MDKLDVVAIGNPFMDILCTPIGTLRTLGSPTTNTAINLSRFGMRAGIIGRIGKDEYGRVVLSKLEQEKIDVTRLRIDEYPTGLCEMSVTHEDREILRVNSYGSVTYDETDCLYANSARAVFTRATPSNLGFIKSLKTPRIYLTLQLLREDSLPLDVCEQENVKGIFANWDEFERFRDRVPDLLDRGKIIFQTGGKNGCVIHSSRGSIVVNPYSVKSVDPTGAGDAFAAGAIYADCQGWKLEKVGRFANTVGALATTYYGATEKRITLDEVFGLIK